MEERRKKAEYRSSIRSKTLIRNALVSLMQEKPFEKITITDIVRRADINRGTFYAHFKDSREVLERIRSDALSEMKDLVKMMESELFPERLSRRRRLAEIERGYFSKR